MHTADTETTLNGAARCKRILKNGNRCNAPALTGKNCCRRHGRGGHPTKAAQLAPPELKPLYRKLPPLIQQQVEAVRSQDRLHQIGELSDVSAGVFHAFLANFTASSSLSAEQAATLQKLAGDAQNQLIAAHQVEYDRRNLISRDTLLSIMLQLQQQMAHMIQREIPIGGIKPLADRLVDGVAEAIRNAIMGAKK